MIQSLFNNSALQAAQAALDGLSLRRDLIAQNVANVDTPGYHSQEVNFEATLQKALKSKNQLSLAATDPKHLLFESNSSFLYNVGNRTGGTERADGNNVDIDLELTQMTETGIRYDAISNVVGKKISLLKTIGR
jgi:flagellar basal-body rod protein FlgB